MNDEASYVCDACGEEIVIPVDPRRGAIRISSKTALPAAARTSFTSTFSTTRSASGRKLSRPACDAAIAAVVCFAAALRGFRRRTHGIMTRLTVLYGHPTDPAEFDRYYDEVHIPLAKKMQGLKGWTIGKCRGKSMSKFLYHDRRPVRRLSS